MGNGDSFSKIKGFHQAQNELSDTLNAVSSLDTAFFFMYLYFKPFLLILSIKIIDFYIYIWYFNHKLVLRHPVENRTLKEAAMLRTTLLAVVLAVSTLFSSAVAADAPLSSLGADELVKKVIATAHKKNWSIDINQAQRLIEAGPNFGTKDIVIPRECDATDCQRSIVIDITNSKILDLPAASYRYLHEKGNIALIVNSAADEYFRVSDPSNTGKYPDWLSRKVYVLRDGCLVLASEDKTGHDLLPSEEILADYRSYESYDADFTPLAKPICK